MVVPVIDNVLSTIWVLDLGSSDHWVYKVRQGLRLTDRQASFKGCSKDPFALEA